MQTLEECYSEIANKHSRWSYYENDDSCIMNTWNNAERAFNFLKEYFEYSGKSNVFNDKFLHEHEEYIKYRAQHTISTFLLGIKIAECFGIEIKSRNDNNMNFKYRWFLSCLYHDVGYAFEKKFDCQKLRIISEKGIESLKIDNKFEYIDELELEPFTKEEVDLYLKCRANCRISKPVIDHGIAGGLMLYDKLRKQFELAWNNSIPIYANKRATHKDFYVRQGNRILHFSENHFNEYAKAANAIITHNIWIDTLNYFIKNYSTIPSREQYPIIGLDNNQICFILSVADTIEPIKRDEKYIRKVSIEEIHGQRAFRIQTDENTFKVLRKEIKKLEEWIRVSVQVDEVNITMTISAL